MRRLLPALLVAACLPLSACGASSGDEGGAIVYCHQFIEDRLKSPSSADFPGNGEHQVTELSGSSWRVSSFVDAENSFGASLRTDWTCEISYDESREQWTLESLTGI